MNDREFNAKLIKIRQFVEDLPLEQREQLKQLIIDTELRHQELIKNFGTIESHLSDLRISVKYLVFDLESTRRERDELKQLLEDNSD